MLRLCRGRMTLKPLAAALAVLGFASCAGAQTAPALPASPPAAATGDRLIPLEVTINSVSGGSWALLERNGVLYAPADAFEEWRVTRRPNAVAVIYREQTWYPLGSVPGFEARVNFSNQSVDLVFSPSAFAATRLGGDSQERQPLSPVEPALFLNYDLNLNHIKASGAAASNDLGALTEVGYASTYGLLTSSYVARNLNRPDPSQPRSVRRLETTFTRDFPDRNLTLRLGDSTTRTGLWGRSVYFGGVQLTRNFALTPGFVTQPIPLITGTSSAPSTVELYVNDALRQTSKVPTGPFVIDNFPLLTGGGQARLVVRDVLGRETVVVQPFFSHASLLEKGLSDWSLEAGAARNNLGTDNANYGGGFVSGLWRHGFSQAMTLETRAEWSRSTRNAGLGLTYALPFQLLGVAAAAVSHDAQRGAGHVWVAGVEFTGLRHSFTVHAEGTSQNYRQIGQSDQSLPNRLETSASYSYSSEKWGSVGLALARIQTYDRGTLGSVSANYSMRVGARSSVTLSATRVTGATPGTSVGINLTVPLEDNVTVAASATRKDGQSEGYLSASKGLVAETGLGWRVLGGTRPADPYAEGGLYYQGDKVLLTGDASVSRQQQALRLGAQGGLVFMDGRFFRSRRLDGSFALVEVPGYPDVGVGFQGSSLTRTDARGQALLPRLLPYQSNSIRLDPTELPINAELDSIEQIAVPALRSAVKVVFPVRAGRAALVRIVLDDGEPAPAGAEIELVGDPKEFFVARRGEAFITGLLARNSLRLKWNGASCAFQIELPEGKPDEISRVGPLTCPGITR